MKIGLISDIHGDADHLQQALKLLQRADVDQLLCTGDLVHGEPYGEAVITTLRQQNIACTLGNHDEETAEEQKHPARLGVETSSEFSAESIAYLSTLSQSLRFTFEGKTLLLTHATPWSNNIHAFSYSSLSLFRRMIAEGDADCIVIGHTHEPMKAQIDGVWIFNPGSVYQNRFQDMRSCAILSLPDFAYTVYDLETGEPLKIPFLRKIWKSPHLSRNWA